MSVNEIAFCIFCVIFLLCQNGRAVSEDELSVQETVITRGATASYLKIDLQKFDVRVITARVPFYREGEVVNSERTPTGFSLEDYQRLYSAIAVMSGGYLSSFSPPMSLGLVKSNNILTNRAHSSWLDEGIYCFSPDKSVIEHWTPEYDTDPYVDCLQAGPLLLYNGSDPMDVPNKLTPGFIKLARSVQEQAFICTLNDNSKIIIGVTEPVNFDALTSFLKGKLNCKSALRLTGKETAGLRVKDELYGNDRILLPNAIAVFRR